MRLAGLGPRRRRESGIVGARKRPDGDAELACAIEHPAPKQQIPAELARRSPQPGQLRWIDLDPGADELLHRHRRVAEVGAQEVDERELQRAGGDLAIREQPGEAQELPRGKLSPPGAFRIEAEEQEQPVRPDIGAVRPPRVGQVGASLGTVEQGEDPVVEDVQIAHGRILGIVLQQLLGQIGGQGTHAACEPEESGGHLAHLPVRREVVGRARQEAVLDGNDVARAERQVRCVPEAHALLEPRIPVTHGRIAQPLEQQHQRVEPGPSRQFDALAIGHRSTLAPLRAGQA